MELVFVSFIAGIITVAAPCILPLLPVIVGGTALAAGEQKKYSIKRPLVIATSLAISIVAFTLLLKATTAFLGVPTAVWSVVAGSIVVFFGVNLLFPALWDRIMLVTNLQAASNQLMSKSQGSSRGMKSDILLGAALGPVFNSCSPTYALIVAVVLPSSFAVGFANLIAYAIGVALILLLIGIFGGAVASKLKWVSNPNGWFKRVVGLLFIIVGIVVIFGFDRKIQAYVLENGWYDPVMKIEESLRK